MRLLKKLHKQTYGELLHSRTGDNAPLHLDTTDKMKEYNSHFYKGLPKRMKYKDASSYYTQKINHAMGWDDKTLKVLCTTHLHQANNNYFKPSAA